MLRYFKVSVKKTQKKGIITDNSKKGSIIVKRVIPEVQIGVGIGEMNGVGIREMKGHHKTPSLFHYSLCFSLTKENAPPFDLTSIAV